MGPIVSRRSPYRHKVRKHKRLGKVVEEFYRGKGSPRAHPAFRNKVVVGGNISRNKIVELHESRKPRAKTVDERHNAPIGDNDMWLHAPNRYDIPGVDTKKGESESIEVSPVRGKNRPIKSASTHALSQWKKNKHHTEEGHGGILMDQNHVYGVVVDSDKATKTFGFANMNEVGNYDYISLDALKTAGEHVVIGNTLYGTKVLTEMFKIIGKKGVKLYNRDSGGVLVAINEDGDTVVSAPFISTGNDKHTGIPKLKDINMSQKEEKEARATKREGVKKKKEAIEKVFNLVERKGKSGTLQGVRGLPWDWDEKSRKDLVNHMYREIKKYPESNPLEEVAIAFFDRLIAVGEGGGGKDLVAYKETPPYWWTETEGIGMDAGKNVVSIEEYKKIHGRNEAQRKAEQERQQARFQAVSKGYKKLAETEEKLKDKILNLAYSYPDKPPAHPDTQAHAGKKFKAEEQLSQVRSKMWQIESKYKGRYWLMQ